MSSKPKRVLLGDVAISNGVQTGPFGSQLKAEEYTIEGIPVVMPKDIKSGYLTEISIARISTVKANSLKKHTITTGDIIFPRRGDLRRIGVARVDNNGWICGTGCLRARLSSSVYPGYLHQYVQQEIVGRWLERNALGQTMLNLNTEIVSNLPLILPPLSAQKAIADLLTTWDEAIELTERLIQAKEKRLKGVMHDLMYIPIKNGRWIQLQAKWLFKERCESKRSDLPLLSITGSVGVIPREDTNRKDTSNDDKSKYLRICPGDIGYNTMRMWQGVSALSNLDGIVSPAYTICIPGDKLYPQFVAYLFKMPFMIHRFYRYSQGLTSDTWNLKFPHFGEVRIPLPEIDEQIHIAEIISSAQQEIDLLKQLADKYNTQKRGLMQKMLAGEWRVKPEIINQYMEA
jgi:type I restriction enzyme S subunit